MLYFGDLDPSGWWMLEDIKKRIGERFGLLDAVRYERIHDRRGLLNLL
jgi:hypothetical protein